MVKKIFFIVLIINLLNSCNYKPIYSELNNINFRIIIINVEGDKEVNNFIVKNLERNSKSQSKETIEISFNTKYTKDILAKNTTGTATDYQSKAVTTFKIKKDETNESFVVNERFNFQKMTDKYEEKNYERNIKKNLANSISQKLILRLAIIK